MSKLAQIVESTYEALLDFKEAEGPMQTNWRSLLQRMGMMSPTSESKRSIVKDAIDTNIDGFAGFDKFEEEIEAGIYGVRGRFFPQQKGNS